MASIDKQYTIESLGKANFAVIDFEGIQISKEHCCIRSMSILSRDGQAQQNTEFIPCINLADLDDKYKKTYYYCKKKIHHLSYFPRNCTIQCKDVYQLVWNFATDNNIELFVYKGGCMEKRICDAIGIDCFNIERLGAPKVDSHVPREEVQFHCKWLNNLIQSSM